MGGWVGGCRWMGGKREICHILELLEKSPSWPTGVTKSPCVPQAACDVFCVGDDVNIEKANNSLISNDRSWKRNKFRLTYVAEAPELTQGTSPAPLVAFATVGERKVRSSPLCQVLREGGCHRFDLPKMSTPLAPHAP